TSRQNEFWDNQTTLNFCNSSLCLNNSEECSDKQATINNSSYQKFRDYNGVRISHRALKASKLNYSGPFLLPGDEFNTEDKIFFDAFGSLYCPYSINNKPKAVQARSFIPVDDLPKNLNEVVYKYKDFNNTFNCSGDEPDTCKLLPAYWNGGFISC
ncbi:hypothetical protein MTO96_046291, partial [Rhipicephalus appendiculatus]